MPLQFSTQFFTLERFCLSFNFLEKTLTFQKMVVHGHSVITKRKVILALWVVGGLGLSSDGAHSVVFLSKTGGGGTQVYK